MIGFELPAVPSPQSFVSLCNSISWGLVFDDIPRYIRSSTLVIVDPAGMLLAISNSINPRQAVPDPFVPEKIPAPPPLLLSTLLAKIELSLLATSVAVAAQAIAGANPSTIASAYNAPRFIRFAVSTSKLVD